MTGFDLRGVSCLFFFARSVLQFAALSVVPYQVAGSEAEA
jgi:hypothetical protein